MTETGSIILKEKIGYGLGDAASSMYWKIFGMYLLYFYTDVFGITAAAAGTMFLITRVWDSLFDPVVGVMADRTNSKWGKFRPYLFWMAIPFGLIGILTFYTPALSAGGKLVYAYITYSLMMMAYSLINVPYASLLGVMSPDGKQRTALSSYRMVFAFGGSLLSLWLIDPLVHFFSKSNSVQMAWTYAMIVFALISTLFFWGCFYLTKERIKPIQDQSHKLKDDLTDLFKNKPWWILLCAGVAALIFNSIRDGAAVYYFKYFVGENGNDAVKPSYIPDSLTLVTVYLLLGQASNIIGVIAATPVANKIGKKTTFFLAMTLAAVLSIIFYLPGKDNIIWMMALQICISICAGSIFPLLWSMYADIADYSEWQTGRRATGLIFSSSSMAQKFGWTIGGAATGWLLGFYGFEANTVQEATTQGGIRLMLSLLPAAGAALSAIFILLYPLSEEKVQRIVNDLNTKRTQHDTTILNHV
ncbi:MAG: MFS transporter [Chitinophagaceae bacterium]|nr:MFS transporter [Chitinophagaceae bacterium]